MPSVPRYNDGMPAVRPATAPDVRLSPERPPDVYGNVAAGAGIEAARETLSIGAQIHQHEVDRAERSAMVSDDLELMKLENRLFYDPNEGVMHLKGQEARDAQRRFQEGWQKGIAAIDKSPMSRARREAFLQNVANREPEINRKLSLFVSAEGERFDKETHDSYVEGLVLESGANWLSPSRVGFNIAKLQNAIVAYGADHGQDPQTIKLNIDRAVSDTHLLVISQMVNNGAYTQADQYYSKNQNQIDPRQHAGAKQLIESGRVEVVSSAVVEDVLADKQTVERTGVMGPFLYSTKTTPGASTYSELIEGVRNHPQAKNDPPVLEDALKKAKMRWDEKKAADAEAYDADLHRAQVMVEKGEEIPQNVQHRLAKDMPDLRRRQAQIAASREPKTNWDQLTQFYAKFKLPDSDPESVANMTEADIWKMRPVLDDVRFNDVLERWRIAVEKKDNPGQAQAYRSSLSEDEMVDRAAVDLGYATLEGKKFQVDKKFTQDYWRLRDSVENRRQAYHRTHGRNPDDTEMQRFVDEEEFRIAHEPKIEFVRRDMGIDWLDSNEFRSLGKLTDADYKNEEFNINEDEKRALYELWKAADGHDGGMPPSFEWFVRNKREVMQRAWVAGKHNRDIKEQEQILLGLSK